MHHLRQARAHYRRLADDSRGYLWTYGWGVLWALIYLFLTPAQVAAIFLQPAIILFTSVLILSGGAAAAGVWRGDHLVLERGALLVFRWMTLAYPLSQAVVLVLELITTGTTQRWHLLVLGAWPFVFLWKRTRYLQLKAQEARATPLPEEEDA